MNYFGSYFSLFYTFSQHVCWTFDLIHTFSFFPLPVLASLSFSFLLLPPPRAPGPAERVKEHPSKLKILDHLQTEELYIFFPTFLGGTWEQLVFCLLKSKVFYLV